MPLHSHIPAEVCTQKHLSGSFPDRRFQAPGRPLTLSSSLPIPVFVCRCNLDGQCMRKVGRMKGMPTKLSAVGGLLGTLAAIGNGSWALSRVRVMNGWSHSLQHCPLSPQCPQIWKRNSLSPLVITHRSWYQSPWSPREKHLQAHCPSLPMRGSYCAHMMESFPQPGSLILLSPSFVDEVTMTQKG